MNIERFAALCYTPGGAKVWYLTDACKKDSPVGSPFCYDYFFVLMYFVLLQAE